MSNNRQKVSQPFNPSKRWKGTRPRGISFSQKKTSYNNPRYPQTKVYKQNWINLNEHHLRTHDHKKRVNHIEAIMKRVSEVTQRDEPPFLRLMFLLRYEALVIAYFGDEEGKKYLESHPDTTKHPGWDCTMTFREKTILNLFLTAVNELKKGVGVRSCELFTDADKEFGWYRYQRWIKSLEE